MRDLLPPQPPYRLHVGVIPDGARRWALREEVTYSEAYNRAAQKLSNLVGFLFDDRVSIVSIYLSSALNFRRSQQEVSAFCRAQAYLCSDLLPNVAERFVTRVQAVGDQSLLPDYLVGSIQDIERTTKSQSLTRLNLCVAYDPIEELVEACSTLSSSDSMVDNLWVRDPVDLVIRTSGANLLSSFLPLQCSYARLYFLEPLFNDLEIADVENVLTEFREIARSYGT